MKPTIGTLALLGIAILAIVAVVGLTHPIRVEPGSAPEPTATASAPGDAGSLDSILDAIHLEHGLKRGR